MEGCEEGINWVVLLGVWEVLEVLKVRCAF